MYNIIMFYTVRNIKNTPNNIENIKILECDEEIFINFDDPNVKLLNVDNISIPNIVGIAYISYEDLYIHKKPYEISYYETYFDYNDAYFFGLTMKKAKEIEEYLKQNL